MIRSPCLSVPALRAESFVPAAGRPFAPEGPDGGREGPAPTPGPGDALLVVDVQRDFLPGGALPAATGRRILPALNRCIDEFAAHGLPVLACRDWHPPDHGSFHAQGGPWPAHCIAGTPGAAFPAALRLPASARIVSKGRRHDEDGESAFEVPALRGHLRALGVRRLFIGGLSVGGGIVRHALDARASGLEVVLLRDAVAVRDARPADDARLLASLRGAGVRVGASAGWSAVP